MKFFLQMFITLMLFVSHSYAASSLLLRVSEVDDQQVRKSWGIRRDQGDCRIYRALGTQSQRWFRAAPTRCDRALQVWNQLKQRPEKSIPPHVAGYAVVMQEDGSTNRVWLSSQDRSRLATEILSLFQ